MVVVGVAGAAAGATAVAVGVVGSPGARRRAWLKLLLNVGRVSLALWVRDGHMTELGLLPEARANYNRLARQLPWPEQINRVYLVFFVLPMASLYTSLRARGWTEQDAADAVQSAGIAIAGPLRKALTLELRTERGRRNYLCTVADMFPPPAWEATWVERSENRAAFDVTRCYILDSLRLLGAGPAAPAFCAFDAALHEGACPQLRFSRSGALAMGADRCDFCIEIVDGEAGRSVRGDKSGVRRPSRQQLADSTAPAEAMVLEPV
jgi:hypothetical protein